MKHIRAWLAVILGRAVRLHGVTYAIHTTPAHATARKSPHWQWGPTVDLIDRYAPLGVGYVMLRGNDRRPLFVVNQTADKITEVWELPVGWPEKEKYLCH